MPAKTIPDGAGVTNHFSVSFGTWISEAPAISVSGLKDDTEIIDGPDKRGYSTGQPTRQDLTIVLPSHDPACEQMHVWRRAVENGTPGHRATGTVTVMDAADTPVAIYELSDCMAKSLEASELSMESPAVAQETFGISYSRFKRIGP